MKRTATVSLYLSVFLAMIMVPPLHAGFIEDGAPVCTSPGNQEYLHIAADGAGGAFIVWEDNRSYRDIYAQRIDEWGRPQWTVNGIGICTYTYGQYGPFVIPDGSGGAIVVWQDGRPHPNRDIYAQRIDAGGTAIWTADGVAVCAAAENQSKPVACADGTGGAIFAWTDPRTSSLTDIYAQRIDASGDPVWTGGGVAICTADGIQDECRIVPDGRGGAIITWEDYRSGGDIYAQRIDAGGGVLWTANGIAVCAATGIQYEPHIAQDGSNGAVITWYDHRTSYDIYVQRLDSLGNALWTANGVGLCVDGEWQAYARVAGDGEGGAVVTWCDNRNGGYDCYAQRVDPYGTVKWLANGEAICDAAGACSDITICPDGARGAVIAWRDSRNVYSDIYVQRIDSTGTCLWTANGDSICTAVNNQTNTVIATDGTGGAIIAWQDERAGLSNRDIYAMRIAGNGDLVATLLQGWSARVDNSATVITWTLSGTNEGAVFDVLRAPGSGGRFARLDEPEITRNGMSFSFKDTSCRPGEGYRYRIDCTLGGCRTVLLETGTIRIPPIDFTLDQNHPNPFNPATVIAFGIRERAAVSLRVYDAAGRLVRTLVDEIRPAGAYEEAWNGTDGHGRAVASGVYFYRLTAGKFGDTRKMVLLR